MPTNTYVALDQITVPSSTPSVTFSNINQSYAHLEIVVNGGFVSNNDELCLRFNGDTTNNYSTTFTIGDGGSAIATRQTNNSSFNAGRMGSTALRGYSKIKLNSYTSSTKLKTVIARTGSSIGPTGGAGGYVYMNSGLWRASAQAITSITFFEAGGYNILAGTTFTLYGISSVAGDSTPKAIGGEVFSDSTYYYHAFKGSGTFAPLQSLTADILVVGAGGGTSGAGGGSGAGGLLGFSSQSLTVQNYPVIVGAGGTRGTTTDVYPTNGNSSKFGSLTTVLGGAYGAGYMGGPNYVSAGANGGCGGGGAYNAQGQYSNGTAGQGYNGNNGYQASGGGDPRSGGGGGGAGGNATNGGVANTGATGGIGSSAYSSWLAACGLGENSGGTYYIAGGGGGAGKQNGGPGGLGGGTAGTRSEGTLQTLVAAGPYTGSGSGSSGDTYTGVGGGSGVVIVRYAKA